MNRDSLLAYGFLLLAPGVVFAQGTHPTASTAPRTEAEITRNPTDTPAMPSPRGSHLPEADRETARTAPDAPQSNSAEGRTPSAATEPVNARHDYGTNREEKAVAGSQPTVIPRSPQLLGQQPSMPTIKSHSAAEAELIKSEILVIARDLDEARQQQKRLEPYGLRIKRRMVLKSLAMVLSIYRVPITNDRDALLLQLRQQQPQLQAEFNRYYFLQSQQGREYARPLVGLPNPHAIGDGLYLAMLDGKVETTHPALKNSQIESLDITGRHPPPSRHGTAVASLLVGRALVTGALPQARLLAVNIFAPDRQGKLRTRSDWWLQGLDKILSRADKPKVINMSFGGGYSRIIAYALEQLHNANIRMVAAAGNGGREAAVLFPASHPAVIAVAAVDIQQNKASSSPDSPLLDVVAPGVDVWAADLGGKGFYASGSSFAAPWVSAVLAAHSAPLPELTADLGSAGKDPVFGHGLIQWKKK